MCHQPFYHIYLCLIKSEVKMLLLDFLCTSCHFLGKFGELKHSLLLKLLTQQINWRQGKKSFKKLLLFIADRYWSYFLCNIQTSLTLVEKKSTSSVAGGKTDLISSTEDPTNIQLHSVKSSDTTADLISRLRFGISNEQGWSTLSVLWFITGKAEPCHFPPPLPAGRRFAFLAWVVGELPVDVNKWEKGL